MPTSAWTADLGTFPHALRSPVGPSASLSGVDTRFRLLPEVIQAEIDHAPGARRRRIAIGCAALAIQDTGLAFAPLDQLMTDLRAGRLDTRIAAEVREFAERLDSQYLVMHDDEKPGGRSEGWEAAFRAARAAASADAAVLSDPRDAAINAAYEAIFALETSAEDRVTALVLATD